MKKRRRENRHTDRKKKFEPIETDNFTVVAHMQPKHTHTSILNATVYKMNKHQTKFHLFHTYFFLVLLLLSILFCVYLFRCFYAVEFLFVNFAAVIVDLLHFIIDGLLNPTDRRTS